MKKYSAMLFVFTVFFLSTLVFAGLDTKNRLQADIIIKDATILTMDDNKTIIEKGTIVIIDENIVTLNSGKDLSKIYKARTVIEASGKLVMPGLINTHTHAAMTLFRGIADDYPLQEWLGKYIWPAEAKYVNSENVSWGSLLAIAEMIRSGTTTFCDMYFFEDEVATVVKKAGIRAVLGEGLLNFQTPNKKSSSEGLVYNEMLLNKYKNDPLVTIAVAPHSPYTCSPELLVEAKKLADTYKVPLLIHLSETVGEVADMKAKNGYTPAGYLQSIGFFGGQVIAAHCVHLTKEDIGIIVDNKIGVAHNPESNMKLASGVAPIPELLKRKAIVGLGTDGAASNNDLNMFGELSTAAKLHKVYNNDPCAVSDENAVEMATRGGAAVLGLTNRIGTLEVGKKADIIIINLDNPHATPLYNIYSFLAYAIDKADVETTIINGKVIMRNRKILTFNEKEVIANVNKIANKIKEDMLRK